MISQLRAAAGQRIPTIILLIVVYMFAAAGVANATIVQSTTLPGENGLESNALIAFSIVCSADLSAISAGSPSSYQLLEAGSDGIFGNSDDSLISLTPLFAGGSAVSFSIDSSPLQPGRYKFQTKAALTDSTSQPVGLYTRQFSVVNPPLGRLESASNDNAQTAAAIPMTETPSGSAFFTGFGVGSISPPGDHDFWRFDAEAGDRITVRLEQDSAGVYPQLYLQDSAGRVVAATGGDYSGVAQVQNYQVVSPGAYYIRIFNSSGTGNYHFRVDQSRGPALEIEDNDSQAKANRLEIAPGINQARVAGSLPASDSFGDDFFYGALNAGDVLSASLSFPEGSSLEPQDATLSVQLQGSATALAASASGALNYTAAAGGIYYVIVQSASHRTLRSQYLLSCSVTDTSAPAINVVSLPAQGLVSNAVIDRFSVDFSEEMAAATVIDAGNIDLRAVGLDGDFGTADDVIYHLSAGYTDGLTAQCRVTDGPLQPGSYRLTLSTRLRDRAGNAIAAPYLRQFRIAAPLGFVIESRDNDTPGRASSLSMTPRAGADGSFSPLNSQPAGNFPYWITTGDFNGDGFADAVLANINAGNLTVLLGKGDGTFQAGVDYPTPGAPYAVAAGDFNGDGKLDLAAASASTNKVSVLLGDGAGGFGTAASFSVGSSPQAVAIGDFNLDGKLDAVTANAGSNTLSVLLGTGTGSLGAASALTAGSTPYAVAVGDVNGDGNPDLVAANYSSSSISVLLGSGNGTFGSALNYAAGANPRSIALGDMNGDGKLDVITANAGDNSISVLAGSGNGSFGSASSYPTGSSDLFEAILADLNGDGRLDVAAANFSGQRISVLLSNLNGTLQQASNYGSGHYWPSIAAADFNGDGLLDLAGANYAGSSVTVLLGNGIKPLTEDPPGSGLRSGFGQGNLWSTSDADYFNFTAGAGELMVLSAENPNSDYYSYIYFTLYKPDGGVLASFTTSPFGQNAQNAPVLLPASGTYTVGVAAYYDFQGEYRFRVTTARPPLQLESENNDSINNANILTQAPGLPGHRVYHAAGHIAAADSSGDYFLIGTLGESSTIGLTLTQPLTSALSANLTIYDGTGMAMASAPAGLGSLNYFVGAGSGGTFYARVGAGVGTGGLASQYVLEIDVRDLAAPTITSLNLPAEGTISYAVSDRFTVTFSEDMTVTSLNDVGNLDLRSAGPDDVFQTADDVIYTLASAGYVNGTSARYQVLDGPLQPGSYRLTLSTALKDRAGNGLASNYTRAFKVAALPGFVRESRGNNTLSAATSLSLSPASSGDGSFTALQSQSAGSSPFFIAAGDFNRDGLLDIALATNGSSSVMIMLGKGGGTFQEGAVYATASAPFCVAVGDFNGDGKLDLVTSNYGANNVSILLGGGDGIFGAATNFAVEAGPQTVTVGDFNADGKLDVATAHYTSGNKVSVLIGKGNGTFFNAVTYEAGIRPRSVVAGDVNADGRQDLAVANFGSNSVSVLLANPDGTFGNAINYPSGAGPGSVALGDVNGDGKLDLVTANYGDNSASVLLGTGDGSFGAAINYPTGSSDNYQVVLADLNGDGRSDVAIANFGGQRVSFLPANPDGSLQSAVNYGAGLFWSSIVAGDFNNDGRPDLAGANYNSNTVTVLLGNGLKPLLEDPAGSGLRTGLGQGNLSSNDDNDFYSFSASAGETVVIAAESSGSPGGSQIYYYLYGPDGSLLNSFGTDFNGDGQMPATILPAGGTYSLLANTNSNYTGEYRFRVTTAAAPLQFEAEPNDSAASANRQSARPGTHGHQLSRIAGSIGSADSAGDFFQLGSLGSGTTIRLNLNQPASSGLAGVLTLYNAAGSAVAGGAGLGSVEYTVGAGAEGAYYARVSASVGTGGLSAQYVLLIDVGDSIPPVINGVTLPAEGSVSNALTDGFNITFSEDMAASTVNDHGLLDLRAAGSDGFFGTGDDVIYILSSLDENTGLEYTGGLSAQYSLADGPLQPGLYRLTVSAGFTDKAGNGLAAAYVRNFRVEALPGFVFESAHNNTPEMATDLPMIEDPAGLRSGYAQGKLGGNFYADYFRFNGLAGDQVVIAAEIPGSSFGSRLSYALSGPDGGFVTSFNTDLNGRGQSVRVTLPNSGIYTVRVTFSFSPPFFFFYQGEYRLRATSARPPLQLESESNNAIASANTLIPSVNTLGHQLYSVAAYIGLADVSGDYFSLGTLAAGAEINLTLNQPALSKLSPILTIYDAGGTAVSSSVEGAQSLGYTVGTGAAGGYYARVEARAGSGGLAAQYLLSIDIGDASLPAIFSVTLPAEGTVSGSIVDRFTVNFSKEMLAATVNNTANLELRTAGADGLFDTGDDSQYTLSSLGYAGGLAAQYRVVDGPLQPGAYRLRLGTGLADRTGNGLAAPFLRTFSVASQADYVLENRANDTAASATPLTPFVQGGSNGSLQEDPAGSGLRSGMGRGNLSSAADTDHFSFRGAAGSLIMVASETLGSPGASSLRYSINKPDGSNLTAFTSDFNGFGQSVPVALPAEGIYTVQVSDSGYNFTGEYRFQVTIVRPPLQLELENNDSIASASVLLMSAAGVGHQSASVAGYISGAESAGDYYRLGTLGSGTSINLSLATPASSVLSGVFAIYNASGTAVATSAVGASALSYGVNSTGLYYVKVSAAGGTNGLSSQYALTVKIDDAISPVVVSVSLPPQGTASFNVTDRFEVVFSEEMAPATLFASGNVELRAAGPDGVFGTADDRTYVISNPDYATGLTVRYQIVDGPIQAGVCRLTLGTGLSDRAGNGLASPYVRTFSVSTPPGVVIESSSNDTSWTATSLSLNPQAGADGSFTILPRQSVGNTPYFTLAGDFNGDGIPDLAVTSLNASYVSVMLGKGDGTFRNGANYATASAPQGMAAGDLNGDGKLDMVTANYDSNTISVFLGAGDGTFGPAANFPVGNYPLGVTVGDFNGDGKADLATANYNGNDISVLLGNGNGTFGVAARFAAGAGPREMVAGDFNGDGKLDLVAVNQNSNEISVLLGKGDGKFASAVGYAAGAIPRALAAADLNGDGRQDIVTDNAGDNSVSVMLGDAAGHFGTPLHYPTGGSNPYEIIAADVNGDGQPDIVVANYTGQTVSVLLGNADGSLLAATNYSSGQNWGGIGAADFNGDGRIDLAGSNYIANGVTVLLGNNLQPLSEDPPGSGIRTGLGQGNLSSNDDNDYYSFTANAGDLLIIAAESLGGASGGRVYYYLSAPDGSAFHSFATDFNGSGQMAPAALPATGTYHLLANTNSNYIGEYHFRVTTARPPLQFEQENNDAIASATPLVLTAAGSARYGSVAGSSGAIGDLDYFKIGAVSTGESIFLTSRKPSTSGMNPVVSIYNSSNGYVSESSGGRASDGVAEVRVTQTGIYYALMRNGNATTPALADQYVMDVQILPTGSQNYPNLQVASVTPPAGAAIRSGQTVSFSYVVKNAGSVATPQSAWPDRVVLSVNSVLGDGDDIPLGIFPHSGALNSSGSYAAAQTVTLPDGISGDFYLIVATDSSNLVNEFLLEGDNITAAESSFHIAPGTYPDLLIEGVAVGIPNRAGEFKISWSSSNHGAGAANSWKERIIITNSATNAIELTLIQDVTGPLAPSGSLSRTFNFTPPAAGRYSVSIEADSDNGIYEFDGISHAAAEQNNLSASNFDAVLDLRVSNVTVDPDAGIESGANIVIHWTDNNQGALPTAILFNDLITVRNSLSGEILFNQVAPYDPVLAGNGSITGGASRNRQVGLRLPDGPPGAGNLEFIITTDSSGVVKEFAPGINAETNNFTQIARVSTLARYPDLQVADLTVQPPPGSGIESGGSVTVRWNDLNAGTGTVAGAFSDRVTILNTRTGQTLVTATVAYDTAQDGNLAPAGSRARAYEAALPSGLAGVGSLQVSVTADFDNNLFEHNLAGTAEANNSASVSVRSSAETKGPVLSNLKYGAVNLAEEMSVSQSAFISANAADGSGVSRVEFYARQAVGGIDTLIGTGTNGQPAFQAFWNTELTPADGSYVITLKAYDTLGNVTAESRGVHLALAPPAAPSITSPASVSTINRKDLIVTGKGPLNGQISLYLNGVLQSPPLTASADGSFSRTVTLVEGTNQIQAASSNRAGEGSRVSVSVSVDSSLPSPPGAVLATSLAGGGIQLTWTRPSGAIAGYNIYRSFSSFESISQAVKITTTLPSAASYSDVVAADAAYFYRLASVNNAGTESALSSIVSARADKTVPSATTIEYVAGGKYDAVSGRFGPGAVSVTVNVSEPLGSSPFFSITPLGGVPMVIALQKETDFRYTGSFLVSTSTPSGKATATLSLRDLVGNRGTGIGSGGTLLLDTAGPRVIELAMQPAAPIKNNPASPQAVTFTAKLDSAVKEGTAPAFFYYLSNTALTPVPVTSLAQGADNLTWIAVINLAATAGQTTENLVLSFSATDDFDNVSTSILPPRAFEIYQGNLPGLDSPLGLSALSKPGGRIDLIWRNVEGAADYQLFRRATGSFIPLALSGGELAYRDLPSADGTYEYTVAAVRKAGGNSSIGSQSNIAGALSDRVPPGAPANLQVQLLSQGVRATWSAPAGLSEPVAFNLYRASSSGADAEFAASVANQLLVVDPSPNPSRPYYHVTTTDAVGNESAPSNRVYQNAALLPVQALAVSQTDANPPVVTWRQGAAGVAGYDIYQGTSEQRGKLNLQGLLTAATYTDSGYSTGADRTYTVVAVDATHAESLGRSLTLPRVSVTLAAGTIVNRGVMNRLNFTVKNDSAATFDNAQIKVALGGRTHVSAIFSVPSSGSQVVPVVVGGYASLTGETAPMVTTLLASPNAGESVSIVRNGIISLGTSQIRADVVPGEFLVGGSGKVSFRVANTSPEEIEITTGSGQGSQPSPDVRFTVLDADGNMVAAQSFRSVTGPEVVSLPGGQSVVRLPAGYEYLSPETMLAIPAGAPSQLIARLEIDRIYYHQGQPDEVVLDGIQSRAAINVSQTSYTAAATGVTPAESNGNQDIVISGRATNRADSQPVPNVPVLVVITKDGFERSEQVATDVGGNFTYTFKPLAGEGGGLYQVRAIHPDISDRTTQKTFLIRRVLISPTEGTLRTPRNYAQPVNVTATTGNGVTVHNLRIECLAADQLDGKLPGGISVQPQASIAQVLPNQSVALVASVSGSFSAAQEGTVILRVSSDESNAGGWQKITVRYQFGEASPLLRATPAFLDTGVNPGGSVTESVRFSNAGLAAAEGLAASLLNQNGSIAPAWASLATNDTASALAVGETKDVSVIFQPAANVAQGDYFFILRLQGPNIASYDVNIHLAVTAAGQGGATFKVRDPFTGTLDAAGGVIQGVQDARIEIQNEQVVSVQQTLTTDSFGEATASNLPAGPYKYRVNAGKHVTSSGRFWIRPGAVATQEIALNYNPVTVEWEVVPVTLQDSYKIVLNSTFETNVPTPVVVCDPPAVNIPKMCKGDVFIGEFTVSNYGLVRANNLNIGVPQSDAQFKVEMLPGVPTSLESGASFKVAYRMTALKNFGGKCPSGAAPATLLALTVPKASSRADLGDGPHSFSLGLDAPEPAGVFTLAAASEPAPPETGECVYYLSWITVAFDFPCVFGFDFAFSIKLPFFAQHGDCGSIIGRIDWGDGGGNSGNTSGDGGNGGKNKGGTGVKNDRNGDWGPGGTTPPPQEGGTPPYQPVAKADPDCYPREPQLGSPGFPFCRPKESNDDPGCSVNLMNRRFEDDLEDLSLSIPGHRDQSVSAMRKFRAGKWLFFDTLQLIPDETTADGSYTQLAWKDFQFFPADKTRTLFRSGGTYFTVNYKSDLARARLNTANNSWIVFDKAGAIRSVGRNDVTFYTVDYDVSGKRSQVKAGVQVLLTYEWTNETLTAVQDLAGRRVEYTYIGRRLSTVKGPAGELTAYFYDAFNRLNKITDATGKSHFLTFRKNDLVAPAVILEQPTADAEVSSFLDELNRGRYYEFSYDPTTGDRYAAIRHTGGPTEEKWIYADGQLKEWRKNGKLVLRKTKTFRQIVEESDQVYVFRFTYCYFNGLGTSCVFIIFPVPYPPTIWNALSLDITDSNGKTWKEDYNQYGSLVKVTNPDNSNRSYEYGEGGCCLLTRAIDENGVVTEYTYDARKNVVRIAEAVGTPVERVTNMSYDAASRGLTTTWVGDAKTPQAVSSTMYNAQGDLTRVTDTSGNFADVLARNVLGLVTVRRDENGKVWRVDYDLQNRVRETIDADNRATKFEFDAFSNPTSITAPSNRRLDFAYDIDNSLVSTVDSSGKALVNVYDDAGRVARTSDREGKSTIYEYDDIGRVSKVTDGVGNQTHYEYSTASASIEPARIIFPSYERTFTYNERRLVTRTVDLLPDGQTVTTIYRYSKTGELLSMVDGEGHYTKYERDSLSRAVLITRMEFEPSQILGGPVVGPVTGETVSFVYDDRDHVVEFINATGQKWNYAFDAAGRLINEKTPLGKITGFAYDGVGNLAKITRPDNSRIERHFDPYGRVIWIQEFASDAPLSVKNITYTRDEDGRIAAYDDGVTTGEYIFNSVGLISSESVNYGSFKASNTYTYYDNGMMKSYTSPAGTVSTYSYDSGNRLLGVSVGGVGEISVKYNTAGVVASITLPGGTSVNYTHDGYQRPTTIKSTDVSSRTPLNLTLGYSKLGNLISRNDGTGTRNLQYDFSRRLKQGITSSYTYDQNGNRLTESATSDGTWQYDYDDHLLSDGRNTCSYDDNGALISKTTPEGTWIFTYDLDGRLARATRGSDVVDYNYAPDGRRLSKSVNGVVTYFSYSAFGLSAEFNATGDLKREYGYSVASVPGAAPLFVKTSVGVYFYHADQLGAPLVITDADGNIVWRAAFDDFGLAHTSIAVIENNLRFPGQYFDAETGLHYNWNRYYDPLAGRYLQRDPKRDGVNDYLYANANPFVFSDASGLRAEAHRFPADVTVVDDEDLCTKLKKVEKELQGKISRYGSIGEIDWKDQLSMGDTDYHSHGSKKYVYDGNAFPELKGRVMTGSELNYVGTGYYQAAFGNSDFFGNFKIYGYRSALDLWEGRRVVIRDGHLTSSDGVPVADTSNRFGAAKAGREIFRNKMCCQ